MDYTNQTFINDLSDALRCGMYESLKQYKNLNKVNVTGVERTLYPIIREYTIRHLDAIGYSYLTNNPAFFVIGETTILGTNKRSDGFICDVENGQPIFALEIGISNSKKFWYDYEKCISTWAKSNIYGTFLLFFDNEGSEPNINFLDGSVLRTTQNENFSIYPIILPINPNFENAFKSITLYKYYQRHQDLSFRVLTITDRVEKRMSGDVYKWSTNLLLSVLEKDKKILVNHIKDTNRIDEKTIKTELALKPQLIILQGGQNPFENFSENMRILFENYIKDESPKIVVFSDKQNGTDWNQDKTMSLLLPVEFIKDEHRKSYYSKPLKFGIDIKLGDNPKMNLSLLDTSFGVGGFMYTKLKADNVGDIEMIIELNNRKYPFIVSDRNKRLVYISSGTGGWGANWYNQYFEGFQKFWCDILSDSWLNT